MTTELEQKFFKVFGIEPKIYSLWDSKETQIKNFKSYEIYPEITDRKLLEMITSLANALCDYFVPCADYYNLKSRVLYDCIQNKENKELQYNIQQLFKEEE